MNKPVAIAALLASAVLAVAACHDEERYIYSGGLWNADQSCIEPYTPIEAIEGPGGDSTCPPACVTVGDALYVTTVCGAPPANATLVDPKTSPCKEALAAAAKNVVCGATPDTDGGEAGAGDDGGGADDSAAPPDSSSPAPADAGADG